MKEKTLKSGLNVICDTPTETVNMRLRADLMTHIHHLIEQSEWTQQQVAEHCGITQPRVNDLIRGKIEKFSIDALVNINAQLGQSVSLQFEAMTF